jgi:hypothetical protein
MNMQIIQRRKKTLEMKARNQKISERDGAKEVCAKDVELGEEEAELDDAGEFVVETASTWTWALAASASESPIVLPMLALSG